MKVMNFTKALLMLVLMFLTSSSVLAQDLTSYVADSYIGTLSVTIDDVKYEHDGISMTVEKRINNSVNLKIKDFILVRGSEVKPIGDITLTGVVLSKKPETNFVNASTSQNIIITSGSSSSPEGGNTAGGSDQEAGNGWGDNDGTSGTDSGSTTGNKDWYGPSYGTMTVNASGNMSNDYANLSFNVYIPSLPKTVIISFTTSNVPTRIDTTKYAEDNKNFGYTLSGRPASSSHKGIMIYHSQGVMRKIIRK